jgi:hypothetical protein
MSTTKSKRASTAPRPPVRKWGPFHGVSVSCWLNEVETDKGVRYFRTITISRRYKDKKTGEWKDAASLRSSDLPSVILALEAAHAYMSSTPLPGQPIEDEQAENPGVQDDGTPPF